MTIYDKAKWHSEGDFPAGLPLEQAYIHIGFYLGWAIDHGFAGPLLTEDFADELEQYRAPKISAPRLLAMLDGTLDDQMLSTEGNQFTADCYFDDYLSLYEATFPRAKSLYDVENTPGNFARISAALDRFYGQWKARQK